MKLHTLRIVLLVVMTVDALAIGTLRAEHIVVDNAFVVVLKTTLADGQLFISDIRGRNESIADIAVDGIGRHIDMERLEACPMVVFVDKNLDLNGSGLLVKGRLNELFPLAHAGLYLVTINHLLVTCR